MIGLIARPYASTAVAAVMYASTFQTSFPQTNVLNNDYGRVARSNAVPASAAFDFAAAFAATGALPPQATLTRASANATRFNSSATQVTMAADTARFDHDPANARTNYLRYSDFLQAGNAGNNLVTPNAGNAPDGTATATLMQASTANSIHTWYQDLGYSGPATWTMYAKAAGYSKIAIVDRENSGYASFNLATGTSIEAGGGVTSSITALGGGWFKLVMTATGTAVRKIDVFILPPSYTTGNPFNYPWEADGVSGLLVWHGQVENGANSTEYIATAATPVTVAPFRGLLVEPSRTNYALRSRSLATSPNTSYMTTLSTPAVTSFDGATPTTLGVENAANDNHEAYQIVNLPSAGKVGLSYHVKAAGRTSTKLRVIDAGTSLAVSTVTINLSTAAITAGTGSLSTAAGGFLRGSVLGTVFTNGVRADLMLLNATGAEVYAGNGTSGLYFDGLQVELVAAGERQEASSYIATTTAAATRAADVLTLNCGARGLPNGATNVVYVFDDNTTQTVAQTIVGGTLTVPTNLNRAWLRSATVMPPGAPSNGLYYTMVDLGQALPVDVVALLWHTLAGNVSLVYSNSLDPTTFTVAGTVAATTGATYRDTLALAKCLFTLPNPITARYWGFGTSQTSSWQLSRLVVGRSAVFAVGPQKASLGAKDLNASVQTEVGETRQQEDQNLIRPVVSLSLEYAKQSEMEKVLGQYTLGLGTSKPMLICTDLTSAYLQDCLAFGRPERVLALESSIYDVWSFEAVVTSIGI